MSEYERAFAELLEKVLPRDIARDDWASVLLDAGVRPTQSPRRWRAPASRRLAIVTTILVVSAAIPLAAVAVSNGWFSADSLAPEPVGATVVVQSGDWNGIRWTLSTYRSRDQGLCIAFIPNAQDLTSATGRPANTAATACDVRVKGILDSADGQPLHLFTFFGSSTTQGQGFPYPDFIAGAAAKEVARMRMVLEDGRTVDSETTPAPAALGLPIGFFVTEVPAGEPVRTIVALDIHGNPLEQLTLTLPPPASSQTRTTGPASGGVDSSGP